MPTPRLGAPVLTSGQATPETTVNEIARYLEAFATRAIVKDRDLATPPGSPADGDAYLVAASPTGAWASQAGKITIRISTAWVFITVKEGFEIEVEDEDAAFTYRGGAWVGSAGITVDNDATMAANSATNPPSQQATKTYIDGKVAGLSWKQAVRAATTAAGTLASSFENGDTVDGVVLATGNRILIKNQAAAAENGIYTVNASGAPTRASDADSGAELVNASVYVSEGTTLADTQWTCTTNATITVGSTSLAFAQLTSGGTSFASAAEIRTGTEAAKAIAPDQLVASAAPQTLTDGATINWDMASGYNAKVTLGGNRTMAAPTNPKVGLSYALEVIQDGTGSRTIAWNAAFDWGLAGTPTLSTAAGKRDLVFLYCYDAGTPKFRATFNKDA